MSSDPTGQPVDHSASQHAARNLEDVLDDYLQDLAEGNHPDQNACLNNHPEHADALRGIFRTLDFVEATSRSLQTPSIEKGRALGDFRIIREIGRGGMGVVYEACQISLNRKIALKILPAGAILSGPAAERFQREAATAGRLHHTNIVPVHASGIEDGIHYYAMQYISGKSLSDHLKKLRETDAQLGRDYYRRVAQWGRQAADALQYAHEHGAIHRDIKPSNLLLDERDAVWLTDFGLARDDCNASMTMSGDVIGTARYMSPEQARGGHSQLDKRTDIYSLGATLYELLTLQPPYDGDSREAVLSRIAFADPPPPRKVNPRIPRDLETIVLKCMQRNPNDRYASTAEIAEDCRRFLAGESIRARRTSPLVKAVRLIRRHPMHASGVMLSMLLVAAIAFLMVRHRHDRAESLLSDSLDSILFEDNPARANQLLSDAAALGNDTSALHLYRGLIPLLNAQPQRAVAELQDAYRRDSNSIEACYALSAAYYALGDSVNGDRYFQKNDNRAIQTALGWLLRGHALSRIQAPGAIEAFNQAVALRADFTPAIEARAYYRGYRLLTNGNKEDLQPMLNDFDAWVVFRPESARSYAARASGWMFASGYAMSQPDIRGNLSTWLENCRVDLQHAIDLSPTPSVSILTRQSVYFRLVGDFEEAARVLEQALDIDRKSSGGQHEGIVYHRSIALLALGRVQLALAEVEPACDSLPDFVPLSIQRAILLAESGRLEDARASCRQSMDRQKHQATGLCLSAAVLCLLGRHAEAASTTAGIDVNLVSPTNPLMSGEGVTPATVAYLQMKIDADEFLRQASSTPAQRCNAHLTVAISEIGRGNRQSGREHLNACVDTGVFIFVEHRLAQALLARANSDPAWPRWID